jgi:hypothetical protein
VVPLVLVCTFAASGGIRRQRGWWTVLILSLIASMAPRVPGMHFLWEALPLLRFFRFPIKAFVFTTLALAVLSAFAFEALTDRKRNAGAAACIGLGSLLAFDAALQHRRIIGALVERWWNPLWRSDPSVMLEPIAQSIAPRFIGVAAILLLLMSWLGKPKRIGSAWIVLGALVADMTLAAKQVMPTMRDERQASPIVARARTIPGRVFERVARDLDAVRNGTIGRYPSNDASWLAVAQARQGWSLRGSMNGLRYAYDRSPDGSYTWRNQIVQEFLEYASWPERIKWLRAVGVGSVLSSDIDESTPGLRLLLSDDVIGIPVTLHAIERPLPELRAPDSIRWVRTPQEAIAVAERPDFDELREVTMEGGDRGPVTHQSGIVVQERLHEPDRIVMHTRASRRGFVFLARSYSRAVKAFAGHTPLRVVPAMAHLCGVEVPTGEHTITVTF